MNEHEINPYLEAYSHSSQDRWRWRAPTGADTQDIVDLALVCFGAETDSFFRNDPVEYGRNIMLATVSQFYNPLTELLMVAYDGDMLLGYTWARRDERAAWSREEMVSIRMAHVRLDLTAKERITLLAQMLQMWELWARACKVNVIFSSTIRESQDPFLRLHERAGYTVRGSCAYKRLSNIKIDLETGRIDVLK
jgi:hypothetical protein